MSWQGIRDLTSLGISLKIQKGREHDFGKNFYFKPGDRKRLLTVLIVCLIFCNSFLMPVQRAEAVLPVVAAPEIALGAFVGVVAVAAIGMEVFGYTENADKTMAYAQATWVAGNQAMKDAVTASYNAAIAAGDKVMVLSDEVASYWAGVYNSMFAAKVAAEYNTISGEQVTPISYSDELYIGLAAPADYYYAVPGGYARNITYRWRESRNSIGTTVEFVGTGLAGTVIPPMLRYGYRWPAPNKAESLAQAHAAMSTLIGWPGLVSKGTVENVIAKDAAIKKSMPRSIPVPSGQDFVYTPTSNPGVDVHMRNDGTLADDAGKVYAPDQVTVKSAPVPRVATDAAGAPIVDANGVPVVGVPVGAVGVGTSAIPGTLVNVRTGEAVQTKTDDTVANPPLDWASQPTAAINWAPLKTAAGAFTKKFPFSIPWDVGRQLAIFDVQPKTPVWKVDTWVDMPDFGTGIKNDIHLKWALDLVFFDPFMPLFRWFVIIVADVGLMLSLRRFLPE